jgi:hypothetical protein
MDPCIDLRRAQLFGGGMVRAAWPRIQPLLGLSLLEQLDPLAKEWPQEVSPHQPLLP